MENEQRNYTTISPTAKLLLLAKGYTDIPFARAAAGVISKPGVYQPDPESLTIIQAIRMMHFEGRYKSIDQLLQGLGIGNILELSSGFSFRGLDTVQTRSVHYIDSDLPEVVATKQQLVADLQDELILKGKLEVLPLNALDEQQFFETVSHFDDGKLVIVNEGLLMYLGIEEKKRLCAIIHSVLKSRGGYWITADVYIKIKGSYPKLKFDDELEDFLTQHNVEENKFEDFEQAQAFFEEQGFVVEKEAVDEFDKLGSLKYVMAKMSPEQLANPGKAPKLQATWRLRVR